MRIPDARSESVVAYRGLLTLQILVAGWVLARLAAPGLTQVLPEGLALALALAGILLLLRARILVGRRIAAGEAAERDRQRLLDLDPLTGALSRRSFMDAVKDAVRFDMRRSASLLLLDVDHFKAVNDGFGHAAGDALLRHLVEVLRASFPDAAVGRLGGDEFALLLDRAVDEKGVAAIEGFLTDLRRPRTIAGRSMTVGVSIGIAVAPADACLPDELVGRADLALYEAKRRGRGCATAFDPSLMREETRRRSIERELRAAILLDELELHYQPLADADGTVVAVEALVRWRHPVRGMVPPAEFVGVAEQSTLIDMLGEWVLRRAALDAPALAPLSIGINVSGAQVQRDEVVAMVQGILAATGCPAERLVFEITESVAFAATPAVLARLQALRDLGARVSLDDFGTGHNGFHSLHSLPIDSIKIDRSFVQTMESDPIASVLVSAVAAIGRIQNVPVVAEGIETETQRILARTAGCTRFQGYLLGRPQPLAQLRAALASPDLARTG